MLDTIFSSTIVESLTFGVTISIILSSLVLGFGISCVYMYTNRKGGYSSSFAMTLVMIPVIFSMIILLVGNNVARAFSLAGSFSLIRFRSAPGDSKDISYVFFTVGVGLAAGMGYIGYALLFGIILCGVMILMNQLNFGSQKENVMRLKVIIPEDMDYNGVFEEILEEYTDTYKLLRVRTTEFGSLFELNYDIVIKGSVNSKDLIDILRTKNGNLTISMALKENMGVVNL